MKKLIKSLISNSVAFSLIFSLSGNTFAYNSPVSESDKLEAIKIQEKELRKYEMTASELNKIKSEMEYIEIKLKRYQNEVRSQLDEDLVVVLQKEESLKLQLSNSSWYNFFKNRKIKNEINLNNKKRVKISEKIKKNEEKIEKLKNKKAKLSTEYKKIKNS